MPGLRKTHGRTHFYNLRYEIRKKKDLKLPIGRKILSVGSFFAIVEISFVREGKSYEK